MASTNTRAQTETFSRIFGIKNQFKIAFERLMEYSGKQCKPYLDAIQKKVVNEITFWAYTYDEHGEREKWCELVLYVDWDEHEHFLVESKNEIFLKKSWNGTVPEVDVAIGMIEDAIKEFDLIPTFSVGFIKNISKDDYDFYMKKLGLVEGKKVKWKTGSKSVYKKSPKELSELYAEVRVANEFL
jgi:hypothetical protein